MLSLRSVEVWLDSNSFSSDVSDGDSTVSGFSGTRALEHYLLCLQLVLRKQCRWLIEVQLLPAEIEVRLNHATVTGLY